MEGTGFCMISPHVALHVLFFMLKYKIKVDLIDGTSYRPTGRACSNTCLYGARFQELVGER
jgi:hypothetical protein